MRSALDDFDDRAFYGLPALGRLFDALPRHLEAGALLGEDQPALSVLHRHHERVDLVAELQPHRPGSPTGRMESSETGNNALGLVADVRSDLVFVDANDLPAHDLTLVDDGEGRVVIRDQLAVRTLSPDVVVRSLLICFLR
jgi:hypothetical protein